VDERTEAVVELLSGKATVDQVAFRFGVNPKTVERWREVALEGIEQSMRQGTGKSKRERELERKLKALERAFTDLAIRYELLERALSERPTRPLSATGRREVCQMSRETSRGKACVRQLCKAFKVSPQAYYRSRQRPLREAEHLSACNAQAGRRRRQGPWASASELEVGIERVVEGHPGWGVLSATGREEGMGVS